MTFNTPEKLQGLTNFETLLDYLRDELGWPIEVDDLGEATFDYSPEELKIAPKYSARIASIKQLRPLINDQVWGIFFVEFDNNRLPVMALRRILQALAVSRRNQDSSIPAWKRDDLLFICVYTSAAEDKKGQRGITFAHFRDEAGKPPELRTFSWDSRETHFHYIRNLNLNALKWPGNDRDADAWREQWRKAFIVPYRYTIRTAEKLASQMAKQAVIIRESVSDLYEAEGEKGALHTLYERIRIDLIHDLNPEDFADMVAQTITYGVFSAAVQDNTAISLEHLTDAIPDTNSFLKRMIGTLTSEGGLDLAELGVGLLVDLLRQVDVKSITHDFGRQTGGGSEDPVVHFYEQFLNEYDRKQRVERGVFYTPDPVVEYIVKAVDQILQSPVVEGGFGIVDGLASDATNEAGVPLVQILDPATGTGTFLAHIIEHIARRRNPRRQSSETWNAYVANNLLKRLNGFELMMAPYTIAHLKLALKLGETGYAFGTGERLRVFLTNALEEPIEMSETLLGTDYLSHEANEASIVKRRTPIMVVIGNPPYSNFGQLNQNSWILALLDTYKKGLEEKKTNLNDDYIKFLRFAQWRIHRSGYGVLAFITNNSFLDGLTHRVMRRVLIEEFDDIYIMNLHGDAKRREKTPSGARDENVFDIQQGVSISIFVKHSKKDKSTQATVRYRDFWGTRAAKYLELKQVLDASMDFQTLRPDHPYYFFVPVISDNRSEYSQSASIEAAFPVRNAGIVTARDHLTVHDSVDSLMQTVERFASLTSDQAAAAFNLTDSRDWQISLAQNDIRSAGLSNEFVKSILYRPFDRRVTYYTGKTRGFISMPGKEVMRHLLNEKNLALVLVRQIAEGTYSHVLVTNCIIDNRLTFSSRGYAQVFPLYLYPDNTEMFDRSEWPLSNEKRRPNLSKQFVGQFADKMGLQFINDGRGDLHRTFGPEDIFHFAYAVFHSHLYRERYSEQLKIDFPRLPLTTDVELFRQLVMRGIDLVALHLLKDDYEGTVWNRLREPSPLERPITEFVRGKNGSTVGPMSKARAYDAEQKRIYIDTSDLKTGSYFEFAEDVSAEDALETWEFQIGGYQVLHKWLYDRRPQGAEAGRALTDEDLRHYQRVVVALHLTRKLMDDIDEIIEERGGFPLPGSSPEDADVQPTEDELTPLTLSDENPEDEADSSQETSDDMSDNSFFNQRRLFRVEREQLTFDDLGEGRTDESEPLVIETQSSEHFSQAEEAMSVIEGVDTEDEEGAYLISQPFDPREIRILTDRFSLDVLINRLREKEIDLAPAFQRMGGIWKEGNQSRLIESILIRLPLPAFYFDASNPDSWQVIDGLQRLTSLYRFVIEKDPKKRLRLTNMEFLHDLNGKVYDDLDKRLMREIREAQVTAYMIQPGTPTQLKYNIFKRINTGGVPLSAQEIRHALYQGKGIDLLKRLAKSQHFKQATNFSVSPMRMADQELALRFIAFACVPYTEYGRSEDLDRFVNNCIEVLNKDAALIPTLESRFYRAMETAIKVFDKKAFRKQFDKGRVGPVSKALFEAWGINLEPLDDVQVAVLVERRDSLMAKFQELIKDPEFNRAISYSTGNYTSVQLRFGAIQRIIQEVLNG